MILDLIFSKTVRQEIEKLSMVNNLNHRAIFEMKKYLFLVIFYLYVFLLGLHLLGFPYIYITTFVGFLIPIFGVMLLNIYVNRYFAPYIYNIRKNLKMTSFHCNAYKKVGIRFSDDCGGVYSTYNLYGFSKESMSELESDNRMVDCYLYENNLEKCFPDLSTWREKYCLYKSRIDGAIK